MKRRRPVQQSMLTLMGSAELEAKPPFADFKLSGLKLDPVTGQILEVTTVGPECPSHQEAEDSDPWWDQADPADRGP